MWMWYFKEDYFYVVLILVGVGIHKEYLYHLGLIKNMMWVLLFSNWYQNMELIDLFFGEDRWVQ
jgi:hypothetical protein